MVDSISGGAYGPGGVGRKPTGPTLVQPEAASPISSVRSAQPAAAAAQVSQASAPATGMSQFRDLGGSPPVDAEKVAALKTAILQGRYKVDPDATAAAMIRSEIVGKTS